MFIKPVNPEAYEPVFVSISFYQGEFRFDIRHFYRPDGEFKPTPNGVSVTIGDAQALIYAIKKVVTDGVQIKANVTSHLPILVSKSEYKGHTRLDIRHYWIPQGKSTLTPTKKGASIPWEFVPVFLATLDEAISQAPQQQPKEQPNTTAQAPKADEQSVDEILQGTVRAAFNSSRFANVEA